MITREDALNRLALDPVHYALLRQLSEGWDRRRVVKATRFVTQGMVTAGSPLEDCERAVNRALDEAIEDRTRKAQTIVVFRDVLWFRGVHPYTADEDDREPPESAAFAGRDEVLEWASLADSRAIAVCHARALLVPPLPAESFAARSPDGTYDRRPPVRP